MIGEGKWFRYQPTPELFARHYGPDRSVVLQARSNGCRHCSPLQLLVCIYQWPEYQARLLNGRSPN